MKQILLSIVAMLGVATMANAADIELGLEDSDLQNWWGGSYSGGVFTVDATYDGISWFKDGGWDVVNYDRVEVVVNPNVNTTMKIVLQYLGDDVDNSHATTSEDFTLTASEDATLVCAIDHSTYTAIQQIAIQVDGSTTSAEITIKSAKIIQSDVINDFVLDIVGLYNSNSVADWGSGTTAEVSGEALVLTFTQAEWGSYVFDNWSGWDLSAYDTAILTYTYGDDFVTSGNYAQLIVEDNAAETVEANDNDMDRGLVTVDLTSSADINLANIQQIAVQTAQATTITITEIRFTKKGTGQSIQEVKSSVEAIEVARYNLLGQKLSGEQKGINIIVYSDGSSKKVLVK